MKMIKTKEQIIEYFNSGIKKQKISKLELSTKNFYLITKMTKE